MKGWNNKHFSCQLSKTRNSNTISAIDRSSQAEIKPMDIRNKRYQTQAKPIASSAIT
jgi:hypothetical protein